MSEHFISRDEAERDMLACAAFFAERIAASGDRADAMSAVVPRYLERGEVDLAAELANSLDDPFARDRLLIEVAAKCAAIDDDEYALQLADALEDPGLQLEGLERLGIIKADRGQFDAARSIADRLEHPEFILASIAVKQAADGETDSAFATVSEIPFPLARVTAYLSIAQDAIGKKEMEAAVRSLQAAFEDAEDIEHAEERVRSIIEIGNGFVESERKDLAIETFARARDLTELLDNIHRDGFFAGVSVGFLHAGSLELADRALDLVEDKTQISVCLLRHARHFWTAGEESEALEALDESYEMLRSQREIETRSARDRYALFASIAAQFAGFGKGERAIEIAEGIEEDEQSMVALSQVACIMTVQGNEAIARQAFYAIPDEGQKVFALIGMSDGAAEANQTEQAHLLLDEAAENVEFIAQAPLRPAALGAIAARNVKYGRDTEFMSAVDMSLGFIAGIRSGPTRATALAEFSELFVPGKREISEAQKETLEELIRTAI